LPYDNLNFELEEIHIFEDDMVSPFYTVEADGSKTALDMPDIRFYGNKNGANESIFMSVTEDEFRVEYTKEGTSYTIAPASDILDNQSKSMYVAYKSETLMKDKVTMDCFYEEPERNMIDSKNLTLEPSERAGFYKLRANICK